MVRLESSCIVSASLGRLASSNVSSRSGRKSNQMLFSADLSKAEGNPVVVSKLIGGESGKLHENSYDVHMQVSSRKQVVSDIVLACSAWEKITYLGTFH